MGACDPLLARLFRENAARCRCLADRTALSANVSKLKALAAQYDSQAATIEAGANGVSSKDTNKHKPAILDRPVVTRRRAEEILQ